jgi:hypothetical protein
MDFVAELYRFLASRKRLWMMPVIALTVGLGGLLLLTQGTVVAPFIYTLF